MATIRQKTLGDNIANNLRTHRWKTLKALLVASGYSKKHSDKNGKSIIQMKGVQNHLVKLGFNENAAKAIISEIMVNGEEANRLKAADMTFKTFGTYAPEKHIVGTVNLVTLMDKLNNYDERETSSSTISEQGLEVEPLISDKDEGQKTKSIDSK